MDAANEAAVCHVNFAGVCIETQKGGIVGAHLPDGSGGSSRLTGPLSITFACGPCHDVIDGRRFIEMEPGDRDFYLRRAQNRTINWLIDHGYVRVAGLG